MKEFNVDEYVDYVINAWKKRYIGQGLVYGSDEYKTRECEFFIGAMPVFFVLGIQSEIPASWIFNPLGNQPIINEEEFE